jgi:cobyrinic acid a,c-diamide synthase
VKPRRCFALFIAAPASGQGKTTVTAALARRYRNQGLRVRLFKTGPDFLDPMILERASGAPVYQLDLWMGGENHCRQLLYDAAGEADLILIEGVMGLFDGNPSSADLATRFGIPVLAVLDASAMAQTFGALAHGLAHYQAGLPFAGVFANRVAGEGHYHMLIESLPAGLTAFGWLPSADHISLPERHLGLVQAAEVTDLDARIQRAAATLNGVIADLPPAVSFAPGASVASATAPLQQHRIAVAQDAAFAFLYRANLDLLRALGAELVFFSPLTDSQLPAADALYLPGGYPELHLKELAANTALHAAIRAHHAAHKPIVAECGGMMFLLDAIETVQGEHADMVGLLPGQARMQRQLANLGLHRADLPEGTLRGHSFHYSQLSAGGTPLLLSQPTRHSGAAEQIYRQGRLTASYLHWYFPSNPIATARLFLP